MTAKAFDSLARLCLQTDLRQENRLEGQLSEQRNISGLFLLRAFPVPFQDIQATVISSEKGPIYKSTFIAYHRSLSSNEAGEFQKLAQGRIEFTSHHEVKGKFGTRFAYDMKTEWIKSEAWLLERETLLPGARQTRGFGGAIKELRYLTLLIRDNQRALRLFGSYCRAGGKLPLLGEIDACDNDLLENMNTTENDIRNYYHLADMQ